MKRARIKFNRKVSYSDYDDWFTVGSKKLEIPRWTGYSLGFELVKNYIEKNLDKSAGSLVDVSVEKLKILRN